METLGNRQRLFLATRTVEEILFGSGSKNKLQPSELWWFATWFYAREHEKDYAGREELERWIRSGLSGHINKSILDRFRAWYADKKQTRIL